MTTQFQRICLLLLAIPAAIVGAWASFAPRSFYDSFPGFGRLWVSVDGPFNEHLVRDVGAAYLAVLVLSLLALRRAQPALMMATGATWLVFNGFHAAYHLSHLGVFDRTDQVLNAVVQIASVALAAALLIPARTR